MLEYRYARGSMLEGYVNSLCIMLNELGCHAHKNHAKRTFNGDYIEGEPFDYEFFAGGKVYCFDAKENMSGGQSWPIIQAGAKNRITNARLLRQAENLLHCKNNGAEAFFLVAFDKKKNDLPYSLVKFDAEFVYNSIKAGKKKLHFSEGTEFDINKILRGE